MTGCLSAFSTLSRSVRLAVHLVTAAVLTALFHRGGRRRPRLIRWWNRRLCSILNIRVTLHGKLHQGDNQAGGTLLVANHVSWVDIPVLASLCDITFLSKDEVRRWPLIGWLATAAGTLFIRRGGGQTVNISSAIANRLGAGDRIVLFPEGTTTDGRYLRAFFPRLLAPAVEKDHWVQPLAIRYFDDAGEIDDTLAFIGTESFPHHLWRLLRHPASRAEIHACAALEPPFRDRRQLASAAQAAVARVLCDMHAPSTRTEDAVAGGPETDVP